MPIPATSAGVTFILRLPDYHTTVLNKLVEKGVAKSRNDLIIQIIDVFLMDLRREAEKT